MSRHFHRLTIASGVVIPDGVARGLAKITSAPAALFWGVGLPAAGQQLTPASVKAAILGS